MCKWVKLVKRTRRERCGEQRKVGEGREREREMERSTTTKKKGTMLQGSGCEKARFGGCRVGCTCCC